jgi:hypothetical protein
MKEASDVTRARETVDAVSQQAADLDAQFKGEVAALEKTVDPQTEELGKVSLKPTKANIAVQLVTLVWAPHWTDHQGQSTPAWQ